MSITQEMVDRYKERITSLYRDVEQWSRDFGLVVRRQVVELDEGLGQPYPIDAVLLYDAAEELVATLKPHGANIIGAEGQLRIIGKYDERFITYYVDKGPSIDAERSVQGVVRERFALYLFPAINEPGWYLITDPNTGMTRRLDAALLKEILMEVSDYGL